MTRKEKLDALETKLKTGVADYLTSDKYKELLHVMSLFHSYSFNNCLLIAMQKPDATYVASFTTWKNKLNRIVKKGEKALQIFAPMKYKTRDKETGEEIEKLLFRTTSVFDISQTIPIPELPEIQIQLGLQELSGSVVDFEELLNRIENIAPVSISFEDIKGEAKGYYSETLGKIVIKNDMSELQTIKTLLHELAHSILHSSAALGERRPSRETKEVEAESTAFMVAQMLGFDTSSYSFEYIGTWEGKDDMKLLNESMTLIRDTANHIMSYLFPSHTQSIQEDIHNEPTTFS